MSEVLVDDDNNALPEDDDLTDPAPDLINNCANSKSDARRRLERLLEERRLRDELEDGFDY